MCALNRKCPVHEHLATTHGVSVDGHRGAPTRALIGMWSMKLLNHPILNHDVGIRVGGLDILDSPDDHFQSNVITLNKARIFRDALPYIFPS
jgi:hypothetical protein